MAQYEELELPTECFSVEKLQDYYYKDNIRKNYTETIKYINKYYFEASLGTYIYYNYREDFKKSEKGTFEIRTDIEFKKEVIRKVDYNKAIMAEIGMTSKIHTVVNELFKPRYYKINGRYYLNECVGFKHKKYKQYDEYDKETKDAVQMMLDFINEVSCCNNKEMFLSYLKYLATLCRGKKTEVIIYKKSIEGTGKSTESKFLMKYVFGKNVCLISGTEPLLTNNNKIFMGKVFVVFEELPTFSKAQWESVSSKLKTLTTEDTCVYRDLYEKQISSSNLLNFQINTNVEALKDSQGRRIIILDINPSRLEDYKYFENLKRICFNDKVGEAFYSYLMTKITDDDVNNFNAQRDFPKTKNKLLAISNQLNSAYKFIKMEYILKKKAINKTSCKEFYDDYIDFCNDNKIQFQYGKNTFYQTLETVKIKRMDVKNSPYFKVSLKQLNEIATTGKWICEYDEFENDDDKDPVEQLYPKLSKMDKDKDDENKDNEIEKLQNKILELEEMLKNNKKKQMEENKRVMKPDNEKERLKEENKKVNECFMDAMDENKKLRKLLCKHNISYSYIDIKFNDIIDNIEENIEEDEVKPKEKTKEKSYGEEHAERQAVIIENERKKLKEQNKLLRQKEKETINKEDEVIIKGEKKRNKKKYKNSIEEIFESKNIKEMNEIDF